MNNDGTITIDYLAGLIDGEGYVGIRRCITKDDMLIPEFKPTITIANTNYALMVALKSNFYGSINKKKNSKVNWKKSYSFEFNRSEIKRILPLIINKLIIKKKQAEILLKLIGTYRQVVPFQGYTLEEVNFKEQLHKDCLLLNHRGV